MILDYGYDKNIKQMSISYIDEDGNKKILHYDNLQRFRTYYYTPSGRYNTVYLLIIKKKSYCLFICRYRICQAKNLSSMSHDVASRHYLDLFPISDFP